MEAMTFEERMKSIESIAMSPKESLLAVERAKMFAEIVEFQLEKLRPQDAEADEIFMFLVKTYLQETAADIEDVEL